MENKLMYIGITHETASVAERAYFVLNAEQKDELTQLLKQRLSIKALVIVTTCNRTEIYFESGFATTAQVKAHLVTHAETLHHTKLSGRAFTMIDNSIDTVKQLLYVANGLRSAVLGDKQIITQIKSSYQTALNQHNQGSLLERAFQAVFRSHKRIHSASLFQHGSTSTAYSALKMAESFFTKAETPKLSVLIIGAGDIAETTLKYLPKFNFKAVAISNRTDSKALALAQQYKVDTYDWQRILKNDFEQFDVIISAISNCQHLISQVTGSLKKRLWLDLAMPSNINPAIGDSHNTIYNIDKVAKQISAVSETQLQAIPTVELILKEELTVFNDWLNKATFRSELRVQKAAIRQLLQETLSISPDHTEETVEKLINKIVRERVKAMC